MSGLNLHTSNRVETLLEDLVTVVGKPLPSVLQPEIIVVQSLGMGRWLSLQLAKSRGSVPMCSSHSRSRFLSDVFRVALPETPESKDFDRRGDDLAADESFTANDRKTGVRGGAQLCSAGSDRDLNAFNSLRRSPTRSISTSLSDRK